MYIIIHILYCIRVSTKTTIFRLMILGSTTKLQVDPAETLSPDSRRWRKTLDISHGNQRSWWFNGQFFMGEMMGKCPLGMDMDPMRMDFFRHGHGNSGFSTWILGDTEKTYRWGYGMRIWDFFDGIIGIETYDLWFSNIPIVSSFLSFPLVQWDMDDYGCENGDWTNKHGLQWGYIHIYFCIVYIYIAHNQQYHIFGEWTSIWELCHIHQEYRVILNRKHHSNLCCFDGGWSRLYNPFLEV